MSEKKWVTQSQMTLRITDLEDLEDLAHMLEQTVRTKGLPAIVKLNMLVYDTVCCMCGKDLSTVNMSSYKGVSMCKDCKKTPENWQTMRGVDLPAEQEKIDGHLRKAGVIKD